MKKSEEITRELFDLKNGNYLQSPK